MRTAFSIGITKSCRRRCGRSARRPDRLDHAVDTGPARLRIELHDLIWERMYEPIADAVGVSSERLNRLQFLTIRRG